MIKINDKWRIESDLLNWTLVQTKEVKDKEKIGRASCRERV